MSWKPAKSFASTDSLKLLSLPAHDAALAGDSLYSIQFNHEWRRIVASALQFYWSHGDEGLALDNEDLLNDVLIDLYNAESIGASVNTKTLNVTLSTTQNTTSTTLVTLSGSSFSYTPTKPKALIRIANLTLANSGTGQVVAEVSLSHGSRVDHADGITAGTTSRPMALSAHYDSLPIGTPVTGQVNWRVASGTGTAAAGVSLTVEIIEYD